MYKDLMDIRKEPWRFLDTGLTYPVSTAAQGLGPTILLGTYKYISCFFKLEEKMNS